MKYEKCIMCKQAANDCSRYTDGKHTVWICKDCGKNNPASNISS